MKKLKMAGRILLKCPREINKFSYVIPICNRSSRLTSTTSKSEDQVTHTGQKFDSDDYRLTRFVDKKKHVNEQFAIKLIDEAAPAPRKERVVWCDGGGGPTGHPKVYINLDKPGNHACGYCGLRFYKEPSHH